MTSNHSLHTHLVLGIRVGSVNQQSIDHLNGIGPLILARMHEGRAAIL